MPDRIQKPQPVTPAPGGGGGDTPRAPQVDKPNTDELLKRMRAEAARERKRGGSTRRRHKG